MDSNKVIDAGAPATQGNESAGQESFAEMLAKSSSRKARLAPGQKVKAKVVGISSEAIYIDLGGKSDGIIDLSEFRDENGNITVKEGDFVEAFFVSVVDGAMKMTTLVNGNSTVKLARLQDAFESSAQVMGEIRREIKGGFDVSVDGVRCFCPLSQIDLKGGREGGLYTGSTLPFRIVDFKKGGRTIVLSRRVLLQEEQTAVINRLKETLNVGMELTGKISSLRKFGAFVDLGGIEGLIPASEISWTKTGRPEKVLSAGQEVTARLISVDWEKNRLTLSMKAMQPDPWENISEKYPVGSKINGTIVRLTTFGAFVNLEPGVDGLVHISNLGAGRRINHPREVVEVGQFVEAYVLSVDRQSNKISLSMQPQAEPKKIVYPSADTVISGVVEKVMPFGVFVKIGDDLTGLVPNSEMGTPKGTDHSKTFSHGTEIKVLVIDVDPDQGKVTLSRKGVLQKEEEDDLTFYRQTAAKGPKSETGLSSFGELLKAKLEEKGIKG